MWGGWFCSEYLRPDSVSEGVIFNMLVCSGSGSSGCSRWECPQHCIWWLLERSNTSCKFCPWLVGHCNLHADCHLLQGRHQPFGNYSTSFNGILLLCLWDCSLNRGEWGIYLKSTLVLSLRETGDRDKTVWWKWLASIMQDHRNMTLK